MGAIRSKGPRRRNAQDATRRHDVAPLRRRIEALERQVRQLQAVRRGARQSAERYSRVIRAYLQAFG